MELNIKFKNNEENIKSLKVSDLNKEELLTVIKAELKDIENITSIEISEQDTPLLREELIELVDAVKEELSNTENEQLSDTENEHKCNCKNCNCKNCTCKKSLKVKDLKHLLETLDDESDILATTQYGDVTIILDVLKARASDGLWLKLDDIQDPITPEDIEKLQRKYDLLEKIGYVIEEYYQNPQGLYQDVVKKQKSITPLKEVFQKEAFRMVFDTDFIRTDKFLSTFTSKHVDRKTIRTKIRRLIIKTAENMLDDEDLMLRLENSAMQALEDVYITTDPEVAKLCSSSQFLSMQDLINLSEKLGNDEE